MKKICIIGAGNIGSRHLQGLKKVSFPLSIEVIDSSSKSLNIARERYKQVESKTPHKISFLKTVSEISKNIDLAIIATSSNVRRKVIDDLLRTTSVKYLILEKILFQEKNDYLYIENVLNKEKIKTWVNFSMRTMPFYRDLKNRGGSIQMFVSGSQYGLITNVIHFIDYVYFLTGCLEFSVNNQGLDKKIVNSKRRGFLELTGTLVVNFKDGSTGVFTCYPTGNSPFIIEVTSSNFHIISKESERKAWISSSKKGWKWNEIDTDIPFQSNMTNLLVEKIFKTGNCNLTSYKDAAELHLQLLESLIKYLNSHSRKFNLYPFT